MDNNEVLHEYQALDTRIARVETAITSLSESVQLIANKVNQPFPIWQLLSAFGGMAVIIGALFTMGVQPLFVDTERNRQGLVDVQQILNERSENVAQSKFNLQLTATTIERLEKLESRESVDRERLAQLEATLKILRVGR